MCVEKEFDIFSCTTACTFAIYIIYQMRVPCVLNVSDNGGPTDASLDSVIHNVHQPAC